MGFIYGSDEMLKRLLVALLGFALPFVLYPIVFVSSFVRTPGLLEKEAEDANGLKVKEFQDESAALKARIAQLETDLGQSKGANPERRLVVQSLQGFIVSLTEVRGAIQAGIKHSRTRFDDVTNRIHRYFAEHLRQDTRYVDRFPLKNNPGFEQNIKEQDIEKFLRDCDGRIELLNVIKSEFDV